MKIIHTNQVLAMLALLSQSSMIVEARKTREEKVRTHNPLIPKKIATQTPSSSDPGVVTNVIDGEDAPLNEYPWYSRGLTPGGEWWGCGGTLITPEFVLTAAHCGYDLTSGFQIGALCEPYGDNDNCGQYMETRWASAVYDHPGWDSFAIVNDFTLVQLSEQSTIEFAPPDEGDVSINYENDKPLWVIGLGADDHYGFGIKTFPDHVQHGEVPYVTSSDCNDVMQQYLGNGQWITSVELCAGPVDLSVDEVGGTCNGDSGGPIYDKESNTLVGVTSWGIQGFGGLFPPYCGETPSVYARIADQWEDWIKPTICTNHSPENYPDYCEGFTSAPTPGPLECDSDETLLKFEMLTDGYGEDITRIIAKQKDSGSGYTVYDVEGNKVGNDYGDNQLFEEEFCLPPGCYKFVMYDVFGDGLCCEWGNGYYKLYYDGAVIKDSTFNDGNVDITDFGDC